MNNFDPTRPEDAISVFEGRSFDEPCEIQNERNRRDYAKHIDLRFKNCLFKKGIYLNLNLSNQSNIQEINMQFDGCIFTELPTFSDKQHQIISNDQGEVQITFFECMLNTMDFANCSFAAFRIHNSFIGRNSRIRILNSSVNDVAIRNVIGKFSIVKCPNSDVLLEFNDDNLYYKNEDLFGNALQSVIRDDPNKNMFSRPITMTISDCKSVQYIQDASENTGGFIKEQFKDNKSGKNVYPYRYELTREDIDTLNISVNIQLNTGITDEVKIRGGILNSLHIKGRSNANIDLEGLQCKELYIDNITFKELSLFNIYARGSQTKFQILRTDLGKSEINQVDLASYNVFNIYRSSIQDARLIGTSIPTEIYTVPNIHYLDRRDSDLNYASYEIFRQLKQAMLRQNNQVEVLKMHRRMYNSLISYSGLKIYDKVILTLNLISNGHGTSPHYAFVLLICLLLMLFLSFKIALPNYPLEFGWNGFESFIWALKSGVAFVFSELKTLIILADPTHRLSSLEKIHGQNLSFWNYAISLVSRILVGWCYYQFVAGFRKFGRKL